MNYQEWLESQKVTMFYQVSAEMPDKTFFQITKKVICESEKQANDLIDEWNRLAKITKEIKYSYRRLS